MCECKDGDYTFPKEDPRDTVLEASFALYGIISMLTSSDEPVDRRGLEYNLRFISERLEPAATALQHFRPKV